MSKYRFDDHERYAVYTIHGDKCYLCTEPIDLNTMQVDHVLPEQLLNDREKLAACLTQFGLNANFDLNGFENWLPSCGPCNGRKTATVFKPAPIVLINLQRAIKYSEKTRSKSEEVVTNRKLSSALNTLMRAKELPEISDLQIDKILLIAEQYREDKLEATRHKMMNPIEGDDEIFTKSATEFLATPLHRIIYKNGAMQMVQAPYGVGYQPTAVNPHSSFYCGHCSSLGPWQGAKCMTCGHLDDGD